MFNAAPAIAQTPKRRIDPLKLERFLCYAFCTAGLMLGLASVLLAAGPFHAGIWADAEPVIVAVHLGAIFCAIGIIIGLLTPDRNTRRRTDRALTHRAGLVVALLGVWSLLAALFAPYPFLSWLGSPQMGQGILYYFDFAAFIVAALIVKDRMWPRNLLSGTALLVILLCFGSMALDVPLYWRLFQFDDYLGTLAVLVPPILIWRLAPTARPKKWLLLLTVLAPLPLMAAAGSKTGLVLYLGVGIPVAILGWLIDRFTNWKFSRLPKMLGLGAVLGLATVLSFGIFFGGDSLAPDGPWSKNVDLSSLWSRHLNQKVLAAEMSANPMRIIVGSGWGSSSTLLTTHLNQSNFSQFDVKWDSLWRDFFHSHNDYFEALISVGLPGLFLSLMMPMIWLWNSRRRWWPFTLLWVLPFSGLTAIWFHIPTTAAFLALAVAITAKPLAWQNISPTQRRWSSLAIGVIAFVSLLTVGWLTTHMFSASSAVAAMREDATCSFPDDPWRGHIGLAQIFSAEIAMSIRAKRIEGAIGPNSIEALKCLYGKMEKIAQGDPSVPILVHLTKFRADLRFSKEFEEISASFPQEQANWFERANQLLDLAPDRSDLILPYLTHLEVAKDDKSLSTLVHRIYKHNPRDPVGLWYKGSLLIGSENRDDQNRAILMFNRALDAGIQRFLVIDPKVLESLRVAKQTLKANQELEANPSASPSP